MTDTKYKYRFLARFVIEAETPIAVGTGEKSIVTDAVVATDINGLPFIPGTSIAGVVRHTLEEEGVKTDDFFGFQKDKTGKGSKIIFTDALMVGKEGEAIDGLQVIDFNDEFYAHFKEMPIRQHVRINVKGTNEKGGKFDEQVVFKGIRFVFEMEMYAENDVKDKENFKLITNQLYNSTLRLGGGTRSGFGRIQVIDAKSAFLDLAQENDLELYLGKTSSLAQAWEGFQPLSNKPESSELWQQYTLDLEPADFFLFGSGFSDAEADMTPTTEASIKWEDGRPEFVEANYIILATSVKGALAHRTAYYFNKKKERFADEGWAAKAANENEAVKALFGSSAQHNEDEGTIGNVLIDDIFIPSKDIEAESKLFNHITIDRFTGGVKGGALFTEKTTNMRGRRITIHISVKKSALTDEDIKGAWEQALDDLKGGLLPLGGGTNRGNGTFTENNQTY